jgi:hypothetical protein
MIHAQTNAIARNVPDPDLPLSGPARRQDIHELAGNIVLIPF